MPARVLLLALVVQLGAGQVHFEPTAAGVFTTTIDTREQVKVKIPVDASVANWVRFQLCDNSTCGVVVFAGVVRVSFTTLYPLRFSTYTQCDPAGQFCNATLVENQQLCTTYSLQDEDMVLVVERLPKALAVWMQSCPLRMATAPVNEVSNKLTVTTTRRALQVQFVRYRP